MDFFNIYGYDDDGNPLNDQEEGENGDQKSDSLWFAYAEADRRKMLDDGGSVSSAARQTFAAESADTTDQGDGAAEADADANEPADGKKKARHELAAASSTAAEPGAGWQDVAANLEAARAELHFTVGWCDAFIGRVLRAENAPRGGAGGRVASSQTAPPPLALNALSTSASLHSMAEAVQDRVQQMQLNANRDRCFMRDVRALARWWPVESARGLLRVSYAGMAGDRLGVVERADLVQTGSNGFAAVVFPPHRLAGLHQRIRVVAQFADLATGRRVTASGLLPSCLPALSDYQWSRLLDQDTVPHEDSASSQEPASSAEPNQPSSGAGRCCALLWTARESISVENVFSSLCRDAKLCSRGNALLVCKKTGQPAPEEDSLAGSRRPFSSSSSLPPADHGPLAVGVEMKLPRCHPKVTSGGQFVHLTVSVEQQEAVPRGQEASEPAPETPAKNGVAAGATVSADTNSLQAQSSGHFDSELSASFLDELAGLLFATLRASPFDVAVAHGHSFPQDTAIVDPAYDTNANVRVMRDMVQQSTFVRVARWLRRRESLALLNHWCSVVQENKYNVQNLSRHPVLGFVLSGELAPVSPSNATSESSTNTYCFEFDSASNILCPKISPVPLSAAEFLVMLSKSTGIDDDSLQSCFNEEINFFS